VLRWNVHFKTKFCYILILFISNSLLDKFTHPSNRTAWRLWDSSSPELKNNNNNKWHSEGFYNGRVLAHIHPSILEEVYWFVFLIYGNVCVVCTLNVECMLMLSYDKRVRVKRIYASYMLYYMIG